MKHLLPVLALVPLALQASGCAILSAAASRDVVGLASAVSDAKKKSAAAVDNISAADERAVGQAAALAIISDRGGLVLEEGLNRYVNEVANLVGMQGERHVKGDDGIPRLQSRRFFVGVLNDRNRNAFALPGGYILLTRGLLEGLSSEAELAFVLGHEIAHIDGEDGLNALKGQVAAGSIVTDGMTDFKNSKFFSRISDGFASWLMKNGYDGEAEVEADRRGLQYAMKAGYHPYGARLVLRLFDAEERSGSAPAKESKTHKTAKQRFDALDAAIAIREDAPGAWMNDRYDRHCAQRLEAAVGLASGGGAP